MDKRIAQIKYGDTVLYTWKYDKKTCEVTVGDGSVRKSTDYYFQRVCEDLNSFFTTKKCTYLCTELPEGMSGVRELEVRQFSTDLYLNLLVPLVVGEWKLVGEVDWHLDELKDAKVMQVYDYDTHSIRLRIRLDKLSQVGKISYLLTELDSYVIRNQETVVEYFSVYLLACFGMINDL